MSERLDDSTQAAADARWREVDRLFAEALDLAPRDRDGFLAERCGDDETLRRRVRGLLDAASEPDPSLEGPGAALVRAAWEEGERDDGGAIRPGDVIDRYRVLGELGRGGMATVYDAERADGTFEQRVAIKVLRRGLDTEEIVGRFLAERQILSGLEHPNIARLIDGGATPDGRPYLVMERVEGEPITEWADRRELGVRERLELFCQAADAVQFAHRRLIVHRDLKPSNILVDQSGAVKLLDFGIAKLLDSDTAAVDSLTRTGIRPLTPAYASPEQIRGEQVTTASDVYQLGSVLYELLSGRRPFDGKGSDLESAITTGRVRRPSEASDAGTRAALRGDLDAVVLAALRTEPERRYASVADLAADVRRYLARQPVRARPDTLWYRARRFATRRPEIVAAAAVVALLLGGYVVTLVRHADRLEVERDRAQLESEKARQVSAFLVELFEATDPDAFEGENLTALELLARGEARTDRLADQPELQAEMLGVIGQMFMSLGHFDRAEPAFRRALAMVDVPGKATAERAGALGQLGDVLQRLGRFEAADSFLVASIDMARELGDSAVEANYLNALGYSLEAQGEYERAEEAFREALALRQVLFGIHEGTAHSLQGLAIVLEEQERFAPAESTYLAALDMMRSIDSGHTRVAATLASLGRLYAGQGHFENADSVLRLSLELNRARLGSEHVGLALPLNELGFVAARRGEYVEAERYFRESLAIQERAVGPVHSQVAVAVNNISYTLIEQGRLEEALPLRRRALEIARASIGDSHDNTGWYAFNLGFLLERLDEPVEAEEYYRESLAIMRRALPDGHFTTTTVLTALGDLLARTGRPEEGVPLMQEALADRIEGGATEASIQAVERRLQAALDGR